MSGGAPPLAGIRVLELARVLAGPWAGQVLADLGLHKIKLLTNNPRKIAGLSGFGLEVTGSEPLGKQER